MPANPPHFVHTATYGRVLMGWGSVVGVDGYRIYRKPSGYPSAVYALAYQTESDLAWTDWTPNYDLSDLAAGPTLASYDYKCVTYDSGGESTGLFLVGIMVEITATVITDTTINHPPYNDGADKTGSYTISNPDTVTPSVDDASKSMFENRFRAINRFSDEKTN